MLHILYVVNLCFKNWEDCVRFIDDIKRAPTIESIYSEPRAKVDKKQWHQFSKIKRKPTVLLSASILEYKRRR